MRRSWQKQIENFVDLVGSIGGVAYLIDGVLQLFGQGSVFMSWLATTPYPVPELVLISVGYTAGKSVLKKVFK